MQLGVEFDELTLSNLSISLIYPSSTIRLFFLWKTLLLAAQIPSYPLGQEEAQENLPSFHVWSIDDCFVPAKQSQRLAAMYKRASVFIHRGSHCVPQTKDVVPSYIRFLEKFR